MNIKVRFFIMVPLALASCNACQKDSGLTFMVADPGHFHAALVLKTMYDDLNPEVYVYAPDGPELTDFTNRVGSYQERTENPANWQMMEYGGADFFEKMISEKPGNVLVLAGNNGKKTDYILKAVQNGLNVFADKPMAIDEEGFNQLTSAFTEAEKNGVLLYDMMTERFEISSILQKELSKISGVFGKLLTGTPQDPAVIKESVHHFFKFVSGARLIRPPWFFDVDQEGEGIVDVTTHLIDLVQWACMPDQAIDYRNDIRLISARHWPTAILPEQFREVTGLVSYPVYLLRYVTPDSVLRVFSNGEINYQLKGIHVRVAVTWNYQAPEGGGDTHFSVMKGSLARLEIHQGPEQNFKPELYVIPESENPSFEIVLRKSIAQLAGKYEGILVEPMGKGFHILIPDVLRVGHEAHFAQVTQNYLEYLKNGKLPDWEVPNMIAKYWLTTAAKSMAND